MIKKQETHLLNVINVLKRKIKLKLHTGAVDYHVMQNYSDSNQISEGSGKPYVDIETNNKYIIREFGNDIDPIELMWRRDDEERLVEVLECGKDWKFQYEDDLPINLEPKTTVFILRHQWHRVWKGEGNLKIKIWGEFEPWEEQHIG